MSEKTELEKAIELVEKEGHIVCHPFSFVNNDYLGELNRVLDAVNFRIISAQTSYGETKLATIKLEVVPFKKLEAFERREK